MEKMETYTYLEQKETERFLSKNIVIKIGSSTITGGTPELDTLFMANIASQLAYLHMAGVRTHIVTSGAVACGKQYVSNYDGSMLAKQIAAAAGQPILMEEWRRQFAQFGIPVYQLLLTERDLSFARPVLEGMVGGIPIINANDTVNTCEMSQLLVSADNDRLAGYIAHSVHADTLFLLTDVSGVLDTQGNLVSMLNADEDTPAFIQFTGKSSVGTGGMASKHAVAMQYAREGTRTIIGHGRAENIIIDGAHGKLVGTTYISTT